MHNYVYKSIDSAIPNSNKQQRGKLVTYIRFEYRQRLVFYFSKAFLKYRILAI